MGRILSGSRIESLSEFSISLISQLSVALLISVASLHQNTVFFRIQAAACKFSRISDFATYVRRNIIFKIKFLGFQDKIFRLNAASNRVRPIFEADFYSKKYSSSYVVISVHSRSNVIFIWSVHLQTLHTGRLLKQKCFVSRKGSFFQKFYKDSLRFLRVKRGVDIRRSCLVCLAMVTEATIVATTCT